MSILLWNCRGLARSATTPYKQQKFQKLIGIVFLCETLAEKGTLETLRLDLKFTGCLEVPRTGRGGGLALLWNNSVKVQITTYSVRHIDAIIQYDGQEPWRFTGFYGYSNSNEKHKTWNLMRRLAALSNLPWFIGGDFNCLLSESEKLNGTPVPQPLITGFSTAIQDCTLFDLGWSRRLYTWNRGTTYERLDRGLATQDWLQLYPEMSMETLPTPTSDHCPLLVRLQRPRQFNPKLRPFRFEEMWLLDNSCGDIVSEAWSLLNSDGTMGTLMAKIAECSNRLKVWNREHFGNVQQQLRRCENDFKKLSGRSQGTSFCVQDLELKKRLRLFMEKEHVLWRQKSRIDYLRKTDRNTKYLHSKASARRKHNTITALENEQGRMVSTKEEMGHVVTTFYTELFSTSGPSPEALDQVTRDIPTLLSDLDNELLMKPFTKEEFRKALFQMHPSKAPGPDGMSTKFFQYFWDIVGDDVSATCLSLLQGSEPWPAGFNSTNVVLIPKCELPKEMGDLRPISLCNIIYKIISKALANRMQPFLKKCISVNQSAFVPDRLISDNILIASEVLHYLKTKYSGPATFLAANLDLSKAYGRMEWTYVRAVMQKMGFHADWIDKVMRCMETVRYSFGLNGDIVGSLIPERGLRQGDPISPYLFIIGLEGLTRLLVAAERRGDIHGIKICSGAPSVSHLFFVDDSFLFCNASNAEAQRLHMLLSKFSTASGQCINYHKSEVTFSSNTPLLLANEVAAVLGLRRVEKHGVYLGFPVEVGRSKKQVFKHLKARVWSLTHNWVAATLSKGGKEVMLKSVAAAIPVYSMAIAEFSIGLCRELEGIMNRFWWGSTESKKNIHWMRWERLTVPKRYGGMGFRASREFNLALLCKQGWRLLTKPNSLTTRLLKAKYFPTCDFLDSSLADRANPSYTWCSIMAAQNLLREGVCKVVGHGSAVDIWQDRWLPSMELIPWSPSAGTIRRVSDLILTQSRSWNVELVLSLFTSQISAQILEIPLPRSPRMDSWAWSTSPKGSFSVKSAYSLALQPLVARLKVRDVEEEFWDSLWKLKIPSKIRIFLWKACRDILPSTDALRAQHLPLQDGCAKCSATRESALHAIVCCPSISEVWCDNPEF